jgi:hypothetical protein
MNLSTLRGPWATVEAGWLGVERNSDKGLRREEREHALTLTSQSLVSGLTTLSHYDLMKLGGSPVTFNKNKLFIKTCYI